MTRSYSSLSLWLIVTILAASVMLYHTSDRVTALDAQLRKINAQIESERETLHVLKAEWVYLSNPARIEAQAQRHLNLRPTEPRRVASLHSMNDLIPRQGGAEGGMLARAEQPAPAHVVTVAARDADTARAPRTKTDRIVAALNAGRVNDHMTLQHKLENSGAVVAATDPIGALIGTMGLRP